MGVGAGRDGGDFERRGCAACAEREREREEGMREIRDRRSVQKLSMSLRKAGGGEEGRTGCLAEPGTILWGDDRIPWHIPPCV